MRRSVSTPQRNPAPDQQSAAGRLEVVRLFQNLSDEALDVIVSTGQFCDVGKGEFLFFAGDPAVDAHFLISGQVKIVQETDDGQEVILRLIQAGEIFGGSGGWGAPTHPATAVALEEATVFRLPSSALATLIEQVPSFAKTVIQELSGRLREAEARIRELQVERVERRIARTLLRLASKMGRKTTDGIQIDLPQSRQHLAELSGATLSTVSRVLSEWDRQGLIVAGRERVTIVRPHELVVIADDARPA